MTGNDTTNNRTPLRIGIMGAAQIARKNISAIQNRVSDCQIVAIASRSVEKAETLHRNHVFKDHNKHVRVIAGANAYDKLIESDDVDAIYVPLPVSVKKDWVLKALQAKKHILVEKPVATSISEYQEMLSIAKSVDRYLMDGTMFVHNIRTQHFLDFVAAQDTFGQVTRINSEFTFRGDDDFFANNIRTNKDGDPFGCIGDLGWYCIRLAQLVFRKVGSGTVKRAQVTNWKMNSHDVPIDATCLITFNNGDKQDDDTDLILSFHCSFVHPLRQRVEVCGTKQSATMMDYVIPKEGTLSWAVHGQDLTVNDTYTVLSNDIIEAPSGPAQEVIMWRNFSKYCRAIESEGWNDDDAVTCSSLSVDNQIIADALMESIRAGGKPIIL